MPRTSSAIAGEGKSATAKVRRRPGRPVGKAIEIDRAVILKTAYEMSRELPLADISIVVVAKKLDVTPPLLHYYLSGRDSLTSGVMNFFYRDLVRQLPEASSDWKADLHEFARIAYRHFCEYRGVTSYAVSHNRFRIFQMIGEGETDYGLAFLELLSRRVMAAGSTRGRTGIYGHMLLEYILSSAQATVSHRLPGDHREFLEQRIFDLDSKEFPGIEFTRDGLLGFDAKAAFEEGYRLIVAGLESEIAPKPARSRTPRKPKA